MSEQSSFFRHSLIPKPDNALHWLPPLEALEPSNHWATDAFISRLQFREEVTLRPVRRAQGYAGKQDSLGSLILERLERAISGSN